MRRSNLFYFCMAATMFVLAACSPASEPTPAPAPAQDATPVADAADPVTGTWSGDWARSPTDRNTVTLELRSEGDNLMGTVNPGANAIPLTAATFDPATNAIEMEAEAQGRGGATVRYTIAGTVMGNTMSGTWSHDAVKGDFKLTRK